MKKILQILCLCLVAYTAKAQEQSEHQLFVGNAAVDYKSTENNLQMQMQVGSPIRYNSVSGNVSTNIGFPYGVLYLNSTFEEENFEVSKGYYGDRIQLDWSIISNKNDIDNIVIYKRKYENASDDYFETTDDGESTPHNSFGEPIVTLSSDQFQYIDNFVNGAVLYEYLVFAQGVSSINKKYLNYITGIGYRNPTAVVSGNISFNGGSPVKDVLVRAEPDGAEINFGSSLEVSDQGSIYVSKLKTTIKEEITFQSWARLPEAADFTWLKLRVRDESGVVTGSSVNANVTLKTDNGEKVLLFTVNNSSDNTSNFTATLKKFYPTGEVDGKGDDILKPVSEIHSNFIHLSLVLIKDGPPQLYLNGRLLGDSLIETIRVAQEKVPEIEERKNPELHIVNDFTYVADKDFNVLEIAHKMNGIIDEIRLWKRSLDEKTIRQDFKRYLSGTETDFVMYLRANEGNGFFAYDLSARGYDFNKNKASIYGADWTKEVTERPNVNQLGILGVTDENGNYTISAIPFAGAGESFNITPSLGVHEFNPNQQLIYLGQDSKVANKIDFKDVSSFIFKGRALMDLVGTFNPKLDAINGSGLTEGYNSYSGEGRTYPRGEYQLKTLANGEEILDDMGAIGVADANVYIDGQMVLDKDNIPVKTLADGSFVINVPIGNHYIEVRKDKHNFTYGGRFPMLVADLLVQTERINDAPLTQVQEDYIRENHKTLFEFFEHQEQSVTFLDTTKVTLVGKVVGGSIEAAKPIGFGGSGVIHTFIEGNRVNVSAVNNIGQAIIILNHGNPVRSIEITTNEDSGEYRKELAPLNYIISESGGVEIESNTDIKFLNADEPLNLLTVPDSQTSTFDLGADTAPLESAPYHFEKSFGYRSTPNLFITKQTSEEEITIGLDTYVVGALKNGENDFLIYKQLKDYVIEFETYEQYINKDTENDPQETRVPIVDGEFLITNNLALKGDPSYEVLEVNESDKSKATYSFKAGVPSITAPFLKELTIEFKKSGSDAIEANAYINSGLILGGASDGSQTFVTAAPDLPDIILRDPPGSNSFASIESGQSITVSSSIGASANTSSSSSVNYSTGGTFEVGGGLAGPVIKVETLVDQTVGISMEQSASLETGLSKTYTFNQTISTSDDANHVGANADLYIGNSKNYFYGSYDNLQADVTKSDTIVNFLDIKLKKKDGDDDVFKDIYITSQKAMYFSEEPSNTFFIYSQDHIVNDLIPELELIINNLVDGVTSTDTPGVLTVSQYRAQVDAWKRIILRNEVLKYKAIHSRDELKPVFASLQSYFDENFYKNISFDSSVGEFTSGIETVDAISTSFSFSLDINAEVSTTIGLQANDNGVTFSDSSQVGIGLSTSTEVSTELTTFFSYTLKDNDEANLYSIDVINSFDGNGPIFSTQGGRTSCPYEGAEKSVFFNNLRYAEIENYSFIDLKDAIDFPATPENERVEDLSYATQPTEVPIISAEVEDITNVPEDGVAVFQLWLENTGIKRDNESFNLKISSTTNPYNAITNIGANGIILDVPYGEKTPFLLTVEKSAGDQFEYIDLEIVLESLCDESQVTSSVKVSASFIPSCSSVKVSKPSNNWVVNYRDTYPTNDGSARKLNIELSDFNTSWNTFKKIDLQYRKATASSWQRLHTYYKQGEGDENYYQEALDLKETEISAIDPSEPNLTYELDVLAMDGTYDIRAISSCTDGTEFTSELIRGKVDLSKPQQFGTPEPIDGILGVGEDLRLQFNEPVFIGSGTKIEIFAETNQLPIKHAVSVYFNGAENDVVIDKTNLITGDYSIEFWMNNRTVGDATIMQQQDGFSLQLVNDKLIWTLGKVSVTSKAIEIDDLFHHYTLSYHQQEEELRIYEDGVDSGAETVGAIEFTNKKSLTIGGNNFKGNLHDLRMWTKSLSTAESSANLYTQFTSSQRSLVGYWPMREGQGTIAKDYIKRIHAKVNASWDIKPKTTAYEFIDEQYLTLDLNDFTPFGAAKQIDNEMDVTLSFWVKTELKDNEQAIFSNGRGTKEDLEQSNGMRGKWALELDGNGYLVFNNETKSYALTDKSIADNSWHHVAIVVSRVGVLKTFIDLELASSHSAIKVGGISGSKFWIGARGFTRADATNEVDRFFTGKIDELRLWDTARNLEQISRDSGYEIASTTSGLILYAPMNNPEISNGNGPIYYHALSNNKTEKTDAKISEGPPNYSEDAAKLKPIRNALPIALSYVINGDEIIITPEPSSWAVLEGQILDIHVRDFLDAAENEQASEITWTAYVNKQEIEWFTEGKTKEIIDEKNVNDAYSFAMDIVNKGGKEQPYTISGLPSWITIDQPSGTLAPDSTKKVNFVVDNALAMGVYNADIFMETASGFNDRLNFELRVLLEAPDWSVNAPDYSNSMNVIGEIKINEVFSRDQYTKIGAFVDDNPRGEGYLIYDTAYDKYFVYLTAYSNVTSGEEITFKIWDAVNGQVLIASIDGAPNTSFLQNAVLGSKSTPVLFSGARFSEQTLALNKGWTWTSFYVEDGRFNDIKTTFAELTLQTGDQIKSQNEFTNYENNDWFGSLTTIANNRMYKVNLAAANALVLIGNDVDEANVNLAINEGWNWLPFPIHRNISLEDALALYDPKDGDVIKDQYTFAIYDEISGWSGTLNYMQSNRGYMMFSGASQTLNYPNSENAAKSDSSGQEHAAETIALFSKYNANMSIVAEVIADEKYSEVLVYDVEDNLRGVAPIVTLNNKKVSFISVFSNVNDVLKFKLSDGITAVDITSGFVFENNKVLGSLKNPVILSLESLSTDDLFLNNIVLYPNPFSNKLTVSSVNQLEKVTKIEVYSTIGALITKVVVKTDETIIDTASFAKGIYLIKLTSDAGHMIIKKMVKQ
jgi:hypothetical protein